MGSSTNYTVNIKALFDAGDALTKIKNIQTVLNNLKLPDNLRSNFNNTFNSLNKAIEEFQVKSAQGIKTKTDSTAINKSFDKMTAEAEKFDALVQKIRNQFGDQIDLSNWIKIDGSVTQQIDKLNKEINDLQQQLNNINAGKLGDLEKILNNIKSKGARGKGEAALQLFNQNDLQGAIKLLDQAIAKQQTMLSSKVDEKGSTIYSFGEAARKTAQENIQYFTQMQKVFRDTAEEGSKIQENIDFKETEKLQVATQYAQQMTDGLNGAATASTGLVSNIHDIDGAFKDATNGAGQFVSELGQIKSRIQYFFGLANAINLVKRAVRSSFNTVKELDAAMTETAVVTNYTIKDMWKQLPEYTKRANQLGVTTKAAYESATLYYQQGLNTEQAAALSTETLKMARIAGLDAADATDRMTNALRGFNMELNATQAQRVDDVYSQLAAMSASNVDEISTAMTKVASLAHNANMEFETTAAFLAQIIETTRESAETAGTALKTVVARFSEVKKLYDANQLKGQDEEGQTIDVNKVSAALRTAGIDLNKYFLGEVGLDDVFMELSEKWDSLTNIQQRYIATQAAGSRQQSRFIALMQDYSRTQELVGAAYSSTGASQKQFEKTQDSMESKLARLKNAWDEFAMGLANNAVLKGAVDVLTNILQLINKITNAFGDGLGSIMKWGALIGSLVGVRGIFRNGGFIDKAAGSFLNNTTLGNILFKGGVLSGNLFGDATAANSTARQIVEEAAKQGTTGPTAVTGGSLLRNLFSRKAVSESVNKYQKAVDQANLANGLANMKNFASGKPMTTPQSPNIADVKGLARLGLRINNGRFLGGASKKLAGTKFASGLGKVLGFGGTESAAAAAAGLATALGAVAAAAGAVAIAYKAWYDLSPEGQLKSATKWAETMDKVSENAEKAKNSTKEAYEGYQEKNEAVEIADTAISRQKAISERNQFINDLLQKDNTYAQYLKTSFDNKTGELVLTIDEADMQKVAENAEAGAIKAAAGASLAQAMKAGAQANVYAAQMRRAGADIESKTIRYYDEKGIADVRAMTDAEIAKYSDLSLKQSQEKAAMEAYAKNAYARMIDSNKLGTEIADLVAGALAKTFDAKKYLKEVKDARNEASNVGAWWLRGREYWQEEYYKIYGTRADSSMKNADIASAVGEYKAQAEEEKKTAAVSKLAQQSQYEALFKALNGEVDINLWDDIDKYIEGFGDQLKEVADAMGLYEGDIYQQIKANAKTAKELQKSNLATLSAKALKAGASRDVWSTLLGLDKKDIAKVLDFSDAAEQSLGNGFGLFLDNIPYYIEQGQLDNIGDFFKSFDLNSPISAFKKLNTIAKDETSPILQELAKEVLRINESTFDQGYLTQVFMTSEAYESISESLDKFIEENKEISAANIEELAESCSDLKTLINGVGISAQGLALAFTAVGKGKASIDGITTSVLEALGASKNTTTAIDELFKRIDEFDTGRDFGKAVDFAMSKIGELEKSLENLDFGNETFKKNYEYFFTDKDYKDFITKDTAGRKTMLEGQINRIKGLLDNDALGAMRELANKGIGVKQLSDYIFSWDAQGDWDTVAKQVADQLGVSNEIAETIIAAAEKHIPGLLDQMDLKGYENSIKTFNDSIIKDTVITDQELQVLAEAYGKDIDTIYADMQRLSVYDAEIPIRVKWQNEKGQNLSKEQLFNEIDRVAKELQEDINQTLSEKSTLIGHTKGSHGPGIYGLDPDEVVNYFQDTFKLNESQAKEAANNYAKSVGQFVKEIQIPEFKEGEITYQTIKVTADTIEGLDLASAQEIEKAQWEAIRNQIADAIGEVQVNTEADTNSLSSTRKAIEEALSGITVTVTVDATLGKVSSSTNDENDELNHGAAGGYVSYASGSRKIKPGIALTGEEGPELVWNKEGGYAYLAGKNGPEFNNLRPGDQIFPADETKRIFRRGETPSLAKGGKVVPAYADSETSGDTSTGDWSGYDDSNNNNNNKKKKKSKIDLDKYYNLVEDINELLRIRNLLEKDYEQLLKTEGKTGQEIYNNLKRQLKILEERRKIVEDLAEKRKQQILDTVKENKEYQKYAWWNDEDQTIEIDWDAINKLTNKKDIDAIKEYIKKLEDYQGKYDDMIEQLEEIESTVQEIQKRGQEQYSKLEDRVRDALIKQIQDKIDELTDVNESINNTNQKLFDAINKTLELQRQQRDNAKTEEDLADKEQRLAYLQQDSSNANTLEIAKLQEELQDARQDYTDTLIDQRISELQDQNDEAADQRQQQIDLMQQSLDWQERSGAFWAEVNRLISEGVDETGSLVHGSELEALLKKGEAWDSLSQEGRMAWLSELEDLISQGIAYLSMTRQLEDIGVKKGTQIEFTTAGEKYTGNLDKNDQVTFNTNNYGTITGTKLKDSNKVEFKNSDGNVIGYGTVDKDGKVTFQEAEGQTLTGTVDKNGNVVVKNPDGTETVYKDVFQDYNGKYRTFETYQPENTTSTGGGHGGGGTGSDSVDRIWYEYKNDTTCMKHTVYKSGKQTNSAGAHNKQFRGVSGSDRLFVCTQCNHTWRVPNNDNYTNSTENNTSSENGNGSPNSGLGSGAYEYEPAGAAKSSLYSGFMDGSVVGDILNSRDASNFITLKDVLTSLKADGGFKSFSGGDNYFDINVQVDQMNSDYDVDQAIDRIKTRIMQDSAYRNVNTLSRLR